MNQPPLNSPGDQHKYYPPPPTGEYHARPDQAHLEYGQPPPNYDAPPPVNSQSIKPYSEGQDKIKPSSGWNDVWAIALWLCNIGAFIGLAVVGLRTYRGHEGAYNGVQSENPYPGLTFDSATFKIFGLSAVVGFGLSFLYLILAQTQVDFTLLIKTKN
jgi:hypothetical protein